MIPDSDDLPLGVMRPVKGKALRGDKQRIYTFKGEDDAVTAVTGEY